ncbi:Monothiol glutaredoxin-S4, mitochondrial [Dichanthelium oligosanthes]|uniref:Monothiol glutaredoxin-S4, mitochondrial n=1 Tax=Dichanthelium oligosanthes TaxID=888268 RepID=A0A1E5VJ69_9POAL|nr:Monothiol glutaredoxin-S4, mitochondrial [Dichanthelium oligosanthes]
MNYSSGLGGAPNANGDSTTTRVAADPDTHQDFQPTSKSSDMSFADIVAQDIKEHPVLIYMKGYPDAPSNWPTFPQIFIKGEFVGGSDIILSMHQASEKGELKDLLGDIAQNGEQNGSS